MPDEAVALPTSRFARWIAIAVLILFGIALYFRDGSRLPPITATPPSAPATAPVR